MTTPTNTIGPAIVAARKRAGLTAAELARRIGIFPAPLCAIERGRSVPGGRVLSAICRELGVSADVLLGISPPPPATSDEILIDAVADMLLGLPPDIRREIVRRAR